MSFAKLIADLEAMGIMAKALPQDGDNDGEGHEGNDGDGGGDGDDAAIKAAAAEGGDAAGSGGQSGKTSGELPADGDGEGEGEGKDGGELAKSFSFTLEDGTQVDAVDGTELVKSLVERFESDKGTMLKALGMTVDMLKSQATQIETLNGRITKLSGEGRGRKSAVSVSEKVSPAAGTLQKSEPQGLSHKEFFAKADVAQRAGRITAAEIGTAETYLNRGMAVPAHIISRVLG